MPYPTTSWPLVVDAALSRTDLVDFVMADDFNYPDEQIRTVQDWLGINGDLIGDDGNAAHGPGGVASPIADGGIAFKIAAKVDYTSGKLLSLGDNNDVAYSEKLFVDFDGKMTAVGLTLGATQPVVGILDEDNMVSDSDANLSTQQSIKAYVDATAIGFADPMTTRGDVVIRDPANATARLAVGGANEILTSDGTDIAWAASVGFADPMTTRGDVIFKDAANATVRLAAGGAAEVLTSDGTDIAWAALPASFADPMTTRGDVIIRNAANATARLAVGGAGEILTSDGTDISWGAAASGGLTTYLTVAAARLASGSDNDLMYCVETESMYRYESAVVGTYADDATHVIATADTGTTRWLAISGKYTYIWKRSVWKYGMTGSSIGSDSTIAIGEDTVTALVDGTVAIGVGAMNTAAVGGARCVAIGFNAGGALSAGDNVIIGHNAMPTSTASDSNVVIGSSAGYSSTFSDDNTLIGYKAGYTLANGQANTIIGSKAGRASTGDTNTFVGALAGEDAAGDNNVFIGNAAGYRNDGNENAALGSGALAGYGDTASNAAFGYKSLNAANWSVGFNSAFGAKSGISLTSGVGNVLLGYNAGGLLTTQSDQLYIANTNTATPLIHGDFSTADVTINGDLTVTGSIVGGAGFADPMTTRGDVIIRNAANATARLAVGANTHVLTSDGTDIAWAASVAGFADPMTTRGDVIIRNAANATARLAVGAAAHVLTSDGTDIAWAASVAGFADPMTTRGDLIYKNAAGTTVRLAAGTATHVLTSDGTDIAWAAATGGSSVWSRAGTILSPATSGDTLQAGSGSIGAPSYAFESDVDSGMYYTGTQVGFAFAGALVWQYATTAVTSATSGGWYLKNGAGSVAAPTYAFAGDSNTGLTSIGADSLTLSTGGVSSVSITAQTLTKQYADVAPQIDLQSLKTTPAADDSMGQVRFRGYSSTATVRTYAEIESLVIDDTNTSEDGKLQFSTITGGSSTLCMELYGNDIYTPGSLDASGDISAVNADLSGYVSAVDCKLTGVVEIDSTQVLKEQITGWAAATGTATRSTFLTTNVVLADLAERVKALIDDLMSHGLIGA